MRILLIFLATLQLASGQVILKNSSLSNVKLAQAAAAGGGASTYALVAHASAFDEDTAVTSSQNTTGCKLIVLGTGTYEGNAIVPRTISDNKGNTYTALIEYGPAGAGRNYVQLYYCINPTVGAGHTFSNASTGNRPTICMLAYSYTGTTPSLDTATGLGAGNWTTIQPGSITPAGNNEVFVTSANKYVFTGTLTINSSFTIQDSAASSRDFLYIADIIQTTGGALNPTWTDSAGGQDGGAAMGAWK